MESFKHSQRHLMNNFWRMYIFKILYKYLSLLLISEKTCDIQTLWAEWSSRGESLFWGLTNTNVNLDVAGTWSPRQIWWAGTSLWTHTSYQNYSFWVEVSYWSNWSVMDLVHYFLLMETKYPILPKLGKKQFLYETYIQVPGRIKHSNLIMSSVQTISVTFL